MRGEVPRRYNSAVQHCPITLVVDPLHLVQHESCTPHETEVSLLCITRRASAFKLSYDKRNLPIFVLSQAGMRAAIRRASMTRLNDAHGGGGLRIRKRHVARSEVFSTLGAGLILRYANTLILVFYNGHGIPVHTYL